MPIKKDTPSEFQLRALELIKATGGKAFPETGGWWKGADGARLEVAPVGDSCSGSVGTLTIQSLERKGYLRRDNSDPRPWKDSRTLQNY